MRENKRPFASLILLFEPPAAPRLPRRLRSKPPLPSPPPSVARQSSREAPAPLECRPHRRSSRRFSLFPAAPPASTLSKFPSGFYQPKNYQDAVCYSTQDKFIYDDANPIQDGSLTAVPVGTDKRGLSASFQPCEASRLSAAASGGNGRRWDPLWEVEIDAVALRDASRAPGCHASDSPHGVFEFVKEKQQDGECSDVQDSMNVDDLSELLTHIEAQEEDQGVDFSIFIEDKDALNVEQISDVFSALEDGGGDLLTLFSSGAPTEEDDEDAQNVDAVSELFTSLEQADAEEHPVTEEDTCDAANVDEVSALFSSLANAEIDQEDAVNVDQVADLFSTLEETTTTESGEGAKDAGADKLVQSDWIDSLEVDNFLCLFSELEQKKIVSQPPQVAAMPVRAVSAAAPAVKVDSRIFVPKFSVRIEGSAPAAGRVVAKPFPHPGSSSSSRLLAGPPVFLAGPPQLFASGSLSREDRVERWKEKRKVRTFVSREPDAVVSDTRRACAAKRQRVKGRFTSEKCAFVSITALQN